MERSVTTGRLGVTRQRFRPAMGAAKALLSALVLGWALLGCASAPTQEMSDARRAISSAREVGAERRVAEGLIEAERLLDRAGDALADGAYRKARGHALAAKETAAQSRTLSLSFTRLERLLAAASAEGRDMSNARSVAARALQATRKGQLADAISLVEKATELVESSPK